MVQKQWLQGHFLNDAGLARRDLAEDGSENRACLCVIAVTSMDMLKSSSATAIAFAKRSFGFEHVRVYETFDDDLGVGRYF